MLLGLDPFGFTWIVVGIVIAIIGLTILGYATRDRFDDEDALIALFILICAAFWPIVLDFGIAVGIVSLPILAGRNYGKISKYFEERKQKKKEALEKLEKEIEETKKGVD